MPFPQHQRGRGPRPPPKRPTEAPDPAEDAEMPDIPAAAAQKKSRGRGSSQRRTAAFREKQGAKVQSANQHHLAQKTFSGVESLISALQAVKIQLAPNPLFLPCSTRGAGFMAQIIVANVAILVRNTANVGLTPVRLYRVILGLLSLQYAKARREFAAALADPATILPLPDLMLQDMQTSFLLLNQTFAPLSTLIGTFGRIEAWGKTIVPYVPTLTTRKYRVQTEPDEEPTRKRARRIAHETVDVLCVDPFRVTFENLRDVVDTLSNPDTPLEIRQNFKRFNPIPGCVWSPDDVLANADVIMPADYRATDDVNAVRQFTALAASKLGDMITGLKTDGSGDAALMTFILGNTGNVDNLPNSVIARTPEPMMVNYQLVTGALTLLGEVPHGLQRVLPDPLLYAARSPYSSVQRLETNWEDFMLSLIQRPQT